MKEISHYGPSLCSKFHEKLVYVGYGSSIHVYDYHTGDIINECNIFHRNKVHHIRICTAGYALICGMKSFSVVKLDDLMSCSEVLNNERVIAECIISGEFSYECTQLYLLTCYNEVMVIDFQGKIISRNSVYGERSLLYSGSIKVMSKDEVYVNAGTVMGGVLIWNLFTAHMMHNLVGHIGSIFHVTLSDDGGFVASCSDDRSIRLWDFKTGSELSIGWGHTARIWQLKFFNDNKNLISISEDCTCRVWSISTHSEAKIELVQRNVFEVHLTKNAWSIDVHDGDMIAVSTGNDGRIKLTDLQLASRHGDEQECFSVQDISRSTGTKFENGEIIKGFQWYEFGLVAVTSLGNILTYTTNNGWRFQMNNTKFISYCYVNGVSDENVAVFSNNSGHIMMLKFNDDAEDVIAKSEYHASELSKTNNCMVCKYGSSHFLILLESPNPKDVFLCLIVNSATLAIEEKIPYSKPHNFSSSCVEVYQDNVLVGSRYSTLAIYSLKSGSNPYVVRRINPGDTTTSIKYIETVGGKAIFSVTNRDGYYNFIKINFNLDLHEQDTPVTVIHSNKIVRGFLEHAYMDSSGDYIIHGFKSNLFYIYNETKGYEITSEACGGAHRQWRLSSTSDGWILVYIKASNIFFRRFHKRAIPETLRDGIHGREIRDIAIKKDKMYNKGYLFCTGSEDTSIKLCHFAKDSGRVTTFWTQRKHVSGLQRCAFINEDLFISSSAREELLLWEVDTESLERPFMNLRQVLPTSTTNPDLRIMDFSVQFIENNVGFILAAVYSDSAIKAWFFDMRNSTFHLLLDGKYETCCMLNVCLVQYQENLYVVTTPTDGHLVFYNISNCIPFKIKNQSVELISDEVEILSSALPNFDLKLPVHQSGIKALAHAIDSSGRLKFYTGGDDNAIGICTMTIEESTGKIEGHISAFKPNGAASTITSCGLIDQGKFLVTTSVDQLVKVWDISKDKISLEKSQYVTVADTGSSDSITTEDGSTTLLIGGVGLSIFQVPCE